MGLAVGAFHNQHVRSRRLRPASERRTLPPWRASEQHPTWQRYTREEPRIQPFVRMLSYARATHRLTRWEEIIAILQRERDAAGAQQKSPKEALDDAARAADPLIQEG